MILRSDIVEEARQWLDTPFHHQEHVRSVGCDCGGMIKGIALALGYDVSMVPKNYGRLPSNSSLIHTLDATFIRAEIPQPGDVLLFRFGIEPQHVGIFTGSTVIHAYQTAGKVIEHGVDSKWLRRLYGVWQFRGAV